uniref:Uncharacterized protein n=1 Tax=Bracon brevicornis TaxID=1563983 RepID=A0A6V7JMR2_9HYME
MVGGRITSGLLGIYSDPIVRDDSRSCRSHSEFFSGKFKNSGEWCVFGYT